MLRSIWYYHVNFKENTFKELLFRAIRGDSGRAPIFPMTLTLQLVCLLASSFAQPAAALRDLPPVRIRHWRGLADLRTRPVRRDVDGLPLGCRPDLSARRSLLSLNRNRSARRSYLGDLYAESGQTLQSSFSAVSKPNFASKYALESSRRDLHNALLCTVL